MARRTYNEITDAIDRLCNQVWYNRHQTLPKTDCPKEIQLAAAAAAAEIEAEVDDLGPWSDFQWGMINGKLSALRWVMGDDWDMLDT